MLASALLQLMKEKPYKKISISELAERAQLSRRAFYSNFSSKEDVLHYWVRSMFINYFTQLNEKEPETIYDIGVSYFTYFREYVTELRLLTRNNFTYLINVLNELVVDSPELFRAFQPHHSNGPHANYRGAYTRVVQPIFL